jgi:hypothetical protein
VQGMVAIVVIIDGAHASGGAATTRDSATARGSGCAAGAPRVRALRRWVCYSLRPAEPGSQRCRSTIFFCMTGEGVAVRFA